MGALGIVQARHSSTRLPGKVLMSLADKPVLERVLDSARAYCDQVVVATSVETSDEPVALACARLGVPCVRGPLDDVFARFACVLALPEYRAAQYFYRITADCPLTSARLGRALYQEAQAAQARGLVADYLYFADEELPRGLAPELVRRAAFDAIDSQRLTPDERQHVTLAFYRAGSRFRAHKLAVPPELAHPELRLTLDYAEDAELFRALLAAEPGLSGDAAVPYLLAHPELSRLNRHRYTTAPELMQEAPS